MVFCVWINWIKNVYQTNILNPIIITCILTKGLEPHTYGYKHRCVYKKNKLEIENKKNIKVTQNQLQKGPKHLVWLKLGMRCQKTEKNTLL